MPLLDFLTDVGSALMGQSSAAYANRTNLKNAREQRAWEAEMANTAVQRRRQDIEAAGFNPVLAATGQGAAVPSVSVPTVEPTFRPEWLKGSAAAARMTTAQLRNIDADTAAKSAEARSKTVEADIREQLYGQEKNFRLNRFVEQTEWDDLRTKIMRNQDVTSAGQAKYQREAVDSLIQTAQQQAKAGKLDLEALENLAKVGGLEAGKAQWAIKLIIDLMRSR